MGNIAENLKKVSYVDLEQFVEDINRNFGIIQNSPLYRGIPGEEGEEGGTGLRGTRGSQFLFVTFANFNVQFPGEISNGSKINLSFINSKMLAFADKQKLLLALGTTEFVNKDIIVLSNSIMLSYDILLDLFVDTKMAFNEQSNLVSSIETKIEDYVKYYIENSPALNSTSLWQAFESYAKNYADTNNSFITTTQTNSSVFVPYYPGVTNTIGIKLSDHKYWGLSDTEFPKNNRGTTIFGSVKQYIQLLQNTLSSTEEQTLSSDYAPGENNIPSAVFLQDTESNGLMFGLKTKSNLKSFGSVYKDNDGNVVIKSDQGILPSEYSKLKLNRTSLSYDKQVFFGDNLKLGKVFEHSGEVNSKWLKTSSFFTDDMNINGNGIQVGVNTADSLWKNLSQFIKLTNYKSKVLVTDYEGTISKYYSLETAPRPLDGTPFTGGTDGSKIVTSNYISWLYGLIVSTSEEQGNFWYKTQYNTGIIPSLSLNKSLNVNHDGTGVVSFTSEGRSFFSNSNKYDVNIGISQYSFTPTFTNINSSFVALRGSGYGNRVLVTDANGVITHTYSLASNDQFTDNEKSVNGYGTQNFPIDTQTRATNLLSNKVLTGLQYDNIIGTLNNIKTRLSNIWTVTQANNQYLEKSNNFSDVPQKDQAILNLGGTSIGRNMFKLKNPNAVCFPRFNADNTITPQLSTDFLISLESTTVGRNMFKLQNPNVISFPRFNADNTITPQTSADYRTSIEVFSKGEGDGRYMNMVKQIGSDYFQWQYEEGNNTTTMYLDMGDDADGSEKFVIRGIQGGTVRNVVSFASNGNAQFHGRVYFDGNILGSVGGRKAFALNEDGWLRINDENNYENGIYCGSTRLRTDGTLEVGGGGSVFRANSTALNFKDKFNVDTDGNVTNTGVTFLNSFGNVGPELGTTFGTRSELYTYGCYPGQGSVGTLGENSAFSYSSVVGFGTSGFGELAVGWVGVPRLAIRSKRDIAQDWSSWVNVFDTNDCIPIKNGGTGTTTEQGVRNMFSLWTKAETDVRIRTITQNTLYLANNNSIGYLGTGSQIALPVNDYSVITIWANTNYNYASMPAPEAKYAGRVVKIFSHNNSPSTLFLMVNGGNISIAPDDMWEFTCIERTSSYYWARTGFFDNYRTA